jgi:hypothetical protein
MKSRACQDAVPQHSGARQSVSPNNALRAAAFVVVVEKLPSSLSGTRERLSMKSRERWITLAVAIAGGFLGAMLWNQLFAPRSVLAAERQQGKTITADRVVTRELLIVDPAGRQRAVVTVTPDDLARLSFFSPSGKRRLAMGVLADGEPAVGLYDTEGRARIGLNVPLDDSASVHLVDKSGRARANLVQLPNGNSTFEIYSEDGRLLWSAPKPKEGPRGAAGDPMPLPSGPLNQARR